MHMLRAEVHAVLHGGVIVGVDVPTAVPAPVWFLWRVSLRRMVERREGSAVAQQLAAYRIERHRSLHVIIVRALGRMGDAYLSMDGVGGSERSEWEGRLYRWRLQWESWRGRLACGDAVAGIA